MEVSASVISNPAFVPGKRSAVSSATSADLDSFLGELQALALRIKQVLAGLDESGGAALATRAVLESLSATGPKTVPQLGRERGTSRQNVQIIVNRLLAEGCVSLGSNPAHKRSVLVSITEKGRQRLLNWPDARAHVATHVAGEIRAEELEEARRFLESLRLALNTAVAKGLKPVGHRKKTIEGPVVKSLSFPAQDDNELPLSLL